MMPAESISNILIALANKESKTGQTDNICVLLTADLGIDNTWISQEVCLDLRCQILPFRENSRLHVVALLQSYRKTKLAFHFESHET